jgi:hypothetical protein
MRHITMTPCVHVVSTFDLPPLQHLQPGEPGVIHGTHIHVPCEGASLWGRFPGLKPWAESFKPLWGIA